MPRSITPIDGNSDVQELAKELLHMKESSGLSYRDMAVGVPYSHAQLGRAARGDKLPSWHLLTAYLTACGVSETDRIQLWKPYWQALDLVTGRKAGSTRRRELHLVRDLTEFGLHLKRIANTSAPRTLRTLSDITGISKSAIHDWFRGYTLPSAGNLHQFGTTLGVAPDVLQELLEVRDQLESRGNGGSELARLLATIRGGNRAGSHMVDAVNRVSLALAQAEKQRVRRSGLQPRTPSTATQEPATGRKASVRETGEAYAKRREEAAQVLETLSPPAPARHVADVDANRATAREIASARLDRLQEHAALQHNVALQDLLRAKLAYQSALNAEARTIENLAATPTQLTTARDQTAYAGRAYQDALAVEEAAAEMVRKAQDAVVPVPLLTSKDAVEALARVMTELPNAEHVETPKESGPLGESHLTSRQYALLSATVDHLAPGPWPGEGVRFGLADEPIDQS